MRRSPAAGPRWRLIAIVSAPLLFGLVGNVATGTVEIEGLTGITLIWTATVGLFALLARQTYQSGWPRVVPDEQVAAARADLATQVRDRWADSPAFQRLHQPLPLNLRWATTCRPVSAGRDVVMDEAAPSAWSLQPLTGTLNTVVAAYRALPHGQLVVLGEGGAGKTVLGILLVTGLLDTRMETDPVPVIIPASGWDPGRVPFDDYLTHSITEQFRSATAAESAGRHVVAAMVRRGYILPVLDGLDELPDRRIPAAIETLDGYAASGRPYVVTSRSDAFSAAVQRDGRLLSRAAVVEIDPVDAETAIEYLRHPEPFSARWHGVFEVLLGQPGAALSQVLNSPLMLSLARLAYTDPVSKPAELLEPASPAAIRQSLIDVYLRNALSAGSGRHRGPRRWLQAIAYQMYHFGAREFRWWELQVGQFQMLRPMPGILLPAGLAVLIVVCLAVALTMLGVPPPSESALPVSAFAGAAMAGLFRPIFPSGYPPYQPWGRTPRSRRRSWWASRIAFGLFGGITVGVLSGEYLCGIGTGLTLALVLTVMPTVEIDGWVSIPGPAATLRANATRTLVAGVQHAASGAVVCLPFASVLDMSEKAPTVAYAAAVFGCAAALSAGGAAYVRYRLAHAWLATLGWLPWRLIRFLGRAHHAGVLRQAGLSWEFRHVALQDRLLDESRRQLASTDWAACRDVTVARVAEGDLTEAVQVLAGFNGYDKGLATVWIADYLISQDRQAEAELLLNDATAVLGADAAALLVGSPRAPGRFDEVIARRTEIWDRATQLAIAGRWPDVVGLLTPYAADDSHAARQLAHAHQRLGNLDTAAGILTPLADGGDQQAAARLAQLLVDAQRITDLDRRAEHDPTARAALTRWLAEQELHGRG